MPINQPSNQIKLTNLALVRMKIGKKRFEVACYKNKVLDYRNEIESNIDEVLQSDRVYLDVHKGQFASRAELDKAGWEGKPEKKIAEIILKDGDFQVGQKERRAELDRAKHEVIGIVASNLVNPRTKQVYTTGMIEKALQQLSSQSTSQQPDKAAIETATEKGDTEAVKKLPRWTGVVPIVEGKEAKAQALHAIKCLVAHQPMPLARIRMKLRITCPTSVLKQAVKSAPKNPQSKKTADGEEKPHGTVKDTILGYFEGSVSQNTIGAEWEAVGLIEPGTYKPLNEFIGGHTKGRGNIEVLDTAVGVDL